MDWYQTNPGDDRRARALTAIRRAGVEALLALSPENAAYLAGRTSYIASLWRAPGLAATACTSTDLVTSNSSEWSW